MKRSADISVRCRMLLLSTVALMTVGASIGFGLIHQSPAQDKSANRPTLQFDVASIRRYIPGSRTSSSARIGITDTPDGLVARVVTVKMLIYRAYAVVDYQILGAPDWLNSERYDIDAKFDGSAADELQKLSPSDRILARQRMLQALLAERFNLTIHPDSKEFQLYTLIVAKNGPKLQEVKLDDTEPSKPRVGPAPGTASMTAGGTVGQMRGFASPICEFDSNAHDAVASPCPRQDWTDRKI